MQFSSLLKLKNIKCLFRSDLLSLYHFMTAPIRILSSVYKRKKNNEKDVKAATYIYIRNISIQGKERNVKPPQENKNKFRRTAPRTVI
jgi:hypothetical protein